MLQGCARCDHGRAAARYDEDPTGCDQPPNGKGSSLLDQVHTAELSNPSSLQHDVISIVAPDLSAATAVSLNTTSSTAQHNSTLSMLTVPLLLLLLSCPQRGPNGGRGGGEDGEAAKINGTHARTYMRAQQILSMKL